MKAKALVLILTVVVYARPLLAKQNQSDLEITLKVINEYIEENPHDPNLYFVKGQILLNKNKAKKAIQTFEKVIDMYPEYNEAYYELAKANSETKDYGLALTNIDKFLDKNPQDISALVLKGEIQLGLFNLEQVLSISDQILTLDDVNAKAYLLKGEANFEMGDYDTAYENWKVSKDLGEVEAEVHLKYLFEPVW